MKRTIHPGLELQMSLFSPPQVRITMSTYALHHISIYFLCETKMADDHFVDFATRFSAVAYLRKLIPLKHSTVDIPGIWGVWWRFSNVHMRRSRTTVFNFLNGNQSTLVYIKFHLHSPIPISLSMFRLTYPVTDTFW